MNPASRKAHSFARFLSGLLIAGQLAWGLPAAQASETLRTGQEVETQAAGLEQTLRAEAGITAGLEEQQTVIRLVPIRDYPLVQADPAVLARLPAGAPREVYQAYVRWLNENFLRPPSHNQLIRSMNRRHPSELTSVLDLVERAAAESALPVFVLSHGAEEEDRFQVRPIPDPRDFLAVYLAYLAQNQGRLSEATVPIPADWSWPRLADTLTKNQALQRDDPRMTRLIQGVLAAAQGSQSGQNLPAVLVEVADPPPLNIKVYQAILDELAPTHSISKLLRAYVEALNANRGIPPAISDVLTRADLSLASADSVFREANQRIQEKRAVPIFLRPRWLDPDSNLAKFLAAYLSRRAESLWTEQGHLEIPTPKGWGLARLFELAERYPDHLAPFAEVDPEGLGQLLERIRKTGRSVLPGPHFTEPQLKLIGAHSALIRHPVESGTLPTKKALAEALEIKLSQVTETIDQIRGFFQGNRSSRIFPIRLAKDLSTEKLLEYWMKAYAADHSGSPLEFNAGRLLVAYNAFVRLSGPAERRSVSWEVLASNMGANITTDEARRRLRELDRLFEYVGLPLTVRAGSDGQLQLSDGTPRFQPVPAEGNPIEQELRELFRELVTDPGDEEIFEEEAWKEMLRKSARLPAQTAPLVSIALVKTQAIPAGLEEGGKISRRVFLLTAGIAAATLMRGDAAREAATWVGGDAAGEADPWDVARELQALSPSEGAVIYHFLEHTPEKLEEIPDQVREVQEQFPGQEIFVVEERSWLSSLSSVADYDPEIAQAIRNQEGIPTRRDQRTDLFPERILQEILDHERKATLADLRVQEKKEYKNGVRIEVEAPSLSSVMANLREELARERAFEALYIGRNKESFFQEMATSFLQGEASVRIRDELFKKQLEQLMAEHPGAILFVWRGLDHRDVAKAVDHKKHRFKAVVREHESSLRGAVTFLEEVGQKSGGQMIGEGMRQRVEAEFPRIAVMAALLMGGEVSEEEAMRLARERMEAVLKEEGKISELTRAIQEGVAGQKEGGGFSNEETQRRYVRATLDWLSKEGFLSEAIKKLMGPIPPEEESRSGREETRREMETLTRWLVENRPAEPRKSPVILGASVARKLLLQVLAGLEEWILVDRGDPDQLIVDLMARNADSAVFYGGLEEFRALKLRSDLVGITLVYRSMEETKTRLELGTLVTQILMDLGYSPEAVSAGMEEFLHRLEAVAEAV